MFQNINSLLMGVDGVLWHIYLMLSLHEVKLNSGGFRFVYERHISSVAQELKLLSMVNHSISCTSRSLCHMYLSRFRTYLIPPQTGLEHRGVISKSLMPTVPSRIVNSWRSTTLPVAESATSHQTHPFWNEHQIIGSFVATNFPAMFSFQPKFHFFM